jgi:hypothetical protein
MSVKLLKHWLIEVIKTSLYKMMLLMIIIIFPSFSSALDILATGNWTRSVDADDLTGNAGSNLTPAIASIENQVIIEISNAVDASDEWRVDVKHDAFWTGNLEISVKRTSNGIGSGSIAGGYDLFVPVSTLDSTFFSGSGNRTGINVQIRITSNSIIITPDIFSTALTFTVVDIP